MAFSFNYMEVLPCCRVWLWLHGTEEGLCITDSLIFFCIIKVKWHWGHVSFMVRGQLPAGPESHEREGRGREGRQSKQINPWNIWPVLGIFTHEAPHLIKV